MLGSDKLAQDKQFKGCFDFLFHCVVAVFVGIIL